MNKDDIKIYNVNDGLITTKVHGMKQNAYVVTEDVIDAFNSYSSDSQIFLAVAPLFLGLLLAELTDVIKEGLNFTIMAWLVGFLLSSFMFYHSNKRLTKTKNRLFVKIENLISLQIMDAKYGAREKFLDVTKILNNLVIDGKLDVKITNETMGEDPIPKVEKHLKIKYFYNNKVNSYECAEGERLVLPLSREERD